MMRVSPDAAAVGSASFVVWWFDATAPPTPVTESLARANDVHRGVVALEGPAGVGPALSRGDPGGGGGVGVATEGIFLVFRFTRVYCWGRCGSRA